MAKKKLNLDEIISETHMVADLRLVLTGQEVLCLARLVQYVLEHEDQFDDEESRAASRTSEIVNAAYLLSSALYSYGER
jgi:hypothetical protein